MTRSARKRHLHTIAAELGVEIKFNLIPAAGVGKCGTADSLTATATVHGWTGDNVSYLLGLHELGHFACGHTISLERMQRVYWPRIVEAEAEAWAWALEHTLDRVYEATLRRIRDVHLGSYVRDYGLRTAGVAYGTVASRVGLKAAA